MARGLTSSPTINYWRIGPSSVPGVSPLQIQLSQLVFSHPEEARLVTFVQFVLVQLAPLVFLVLFIPTDSVSPGINPPRHIPCSSIDIGGIEVLNLLFILKQK